MEEWYHKVRLTRVKGHKRRSDKAKDPKSLPNFGRFVDVLQFELERLLSVSKFGG